MIFEFYWGGGAELLVFALLIISWAAKLAVVAIFYVFFVGGDGAANLSISGFFYIFCIWGEGRSFP